MSVSELRSSGPPDSDDPGPDGWSGGSERTPPQDHGAEQSVLGAMLLSKDAIADVVEVVRGADFYRPVHETVYDAIVDLYGRGEPADAITVSAHLQRQGELGRVGGAPYLHTLLAGVPITANAGYYAEIVREKAILRRLVDAGTKVAQLGFSGEGQVDDVVDRAQAEVYAVTDRRSSEDYLPLSEIIPGTLEEIEAIEGRDGTLTGVPTGIADLDALTNGLHPGQMVIVAARPAVGKALALDTPLVTPSGWTTMGAVRVGDELVGADGRPTRVVAATEVLEGRPCYEVHFSDGSCVVADAQHQWRTETRAGRRSRAEHGVGRGGAQVLQRTTGPQTVRPRTAAVVTTQQLAATVHGDTVGARLNHSVVNTAPLDLPEADLSVAPYTLGVWLGAGHATRARLGRADPELALYVEADGYRVTAGARGAYGIQLPRPVRERRSTCVDCAGPTAGGLRCRPCVGVSGSVTARLRGLGLLARKHVPPRYLRASIAQRRALLAGLLDADGTVVRGCGAVQIVVGDAEFARGVYELVVGLGYRCHWRVQRVGPPAAAAATAYLLTFSAADDVFRLEPKLQAHRACRPVRATRTGRRYVTEVRRTASVPVRCVQVDNDAHLYLAGRAMVPTHNSTLALDVCRSASLRHDLTTAIFSLEMSRSEIVMRLLSAEARIPLHHMRSGTMNEDDWSRLARRMAEINEKPLFIDDSPNMTMMEIRAKARRLKQRHDLRLVVVDYLQLMTSGRRVESRQLEVSEFSRSMKLLAKELDVPVVAVSQLNRGAEQRTDKRPQLSDLRESGCLTAGTRLLRADNGSEVTLGELLASGAKEVPVWSLDERLKLVPRTLTHAFPSGTKQVFRVRLTSGRVVEASANHPFLTLDGWRALDSLGSGDRVGVVRHVPPPLSPGAWAGDEVVLLAHLIGDGSFVRSQTLRYASVDEANLRAVVDAARRRFDVTGVRDEDPAARVVSLRMPAPYRLARGRRNPIAAWLDDLGLFGLRSHEKFIPAGVFGLPNSQVALFLRHLWATDGSVRWDATAGQARISYASTSRRLVDDVARLLLRLNVLSRIKRVSKAGYRDSWHLLIYGVDNQRRFCADIGVHGNRGDGVRDVAAHFGGIVVNTSLDTVPREVWERVREVLRDRDMTHRQFASAMGTRFGGSTMWKHAPSRTRLARVAAVLDDTDLDVVATNDVFWDEIADVESLGEQPVYDATVLGTHNFVANGIALHNSLEQDSDLVILLHREDLYEKESTRPGEADIIVAKHRAGPTSTVIVAFQGHYSRFVDMQRV